MLRSLCAFLVCLLAVVGRAGDVVEYKAGEDSGPYLVKLFGAKGLSQSCPTVFPFALFMRTTGEVGLTVSVTWTGMADIVTTPGNQSDGCPQPAIFKEPVGVLTFPMMPGNGFPNKFKDDQILTKIVAAMQRLDPVDGARGKSYQIVAGVWRSAAAGNPYGETTREAKVLVNFVWPTWLILDCDSSACRVALNALDAEAPKMNVLPHKDPANGDPEAVEVEPATPSANPINLVERIVRYLFVPPESIFDDLKEEVNSLTHWGPLGWVASWSQDLGNMADDADNIRIGTHPYEIPFPTPFGVIVMNCAPYQNIIICVRYIILALFFVRVAPPFFKWLSKLV